MHELGSRIVLGRVHHGVHEAEAGTKDEIVTCTCIITEGLLRLRTFWYAFRVGGFDGRVILLHVQAAVFVRLRVSTVIVWSNINKGYFQLLDNRSWRWSWRWSWRCRRLTAGRTYDCLLYTSDAADDLLCV